MGIFDRFVKNRAHDVAEHNTELQPIEESGISASDNSISLLAQQNVIEVNAIPRQSDTVTIPISELGMLGSTAASLLPSFRTVTQAASINTSGLFRLANAAAGDKLKQAKDGNFWGAFYRADGSSKFAKLAEAGPINGTSTTIMPINPATVMVVAALYTMEKKLDSIAETQQQILSFLETEKESQIEADVKSLAGTLKEFKFNWNNEVFRTGHYKQALDVKRAAEKNIQFYQKELQDIKVKAPVIANANVNASVRTLIKKFRYYKMSIYLFAMSSFIEVMLLGNFREEHIIGIKEEIEERALRYRQIYASCSAYIEKIAGDAIEANVLKGIGNFGKTIGGFIGNIPLVKDGPVDEWLQDGGEMLKKNAKDMESGVVRTLAEVGNPDTGIFIEKLSMLNQICNHTSDIYFDKDNIFLMAG